MCRSHRLARLILAVTLVSTALPLAADELGDQLIAATQEGDVAAVRSLLEQGAPVDAKSRYEATPLFFAAGRGNLELVELFLEKGAEVDVKDTFYGATPLQFVLFSLGDDGDFRQIASRLLAHGPADSGAALTAAIESGDAELADAAIQTKKIPAEELASAYRRAEQLEHGAIVEMLRPLVPESARMEEPGIPNERGEALAGRYEDSESGMALEVAFADGELQLTVPGQGSSAMAPQDGGGFTLPAFGGLVARFAEGSGPAETLTLVLPDGERSFARKAEETVAEAAVETSAEASKAPRAATRGPDRPWPAFRGPNGSGIADGQGAPTAWDAESGQNILWKTPIPGLGNSSPVVWGDRVFVTTAATDSGDSDLRIGLYGDVNSVEDDAVHTWEVYALDRKTGKILWRRVAATGSPRVKRHMKSTHANPTPVTDGEYVVASFASEGLATYDFDGSLVWKKDLGVLSSGWFWDPTYEWGFASSPILHDGKVIVQVDIHGGSFIAAFEVETGRQLWRTARDEIPTWGTPHILEPEDGKGPTEIVTNGTHVRGYDVSTGEELWTLAPNSEITVASPVSADGIAYITGGYPPARPIYAVRAGARGDLALAEGESSSDSILWSHDPGGTYMPTPVVYEGILYICQNDGRLAAYDAASGERLYRQRVVTGGSFSGSPVVADGRLYFTSEEGTTYVAATGPEYRALGENELGEIVMSTPAISGGMMIIRAKDHVYGIGSEAD